MTLNRRSLFCAIGVVLTAAAGTTMADVVAVVSSKSPVVVLSKNQVAEIFLGKTTRFPDGTLALPLDQREGSPARDEFYARFAGRSPAQIKSHWAKIVFTGRGIPPRTVSDSVEARKLIAANPQVIGYMERRDIDNSVKVLLEP
jgi:ABC-type phosphate transport system substrate-binding protein